MKYSSSVEPTTDLLSSLDHTYTHTSGVSCICMSTRYGVRYSIRFVVRQSVLHVYTIRRPLQHSFRCTPVSITCLHDTASVTAFISLYASQYYMSTRYGVRYSIHFVVRQSVLHVYTIRRPLQHSFRCTPVSITCLHDTASVTAFISLYASQYYIVRRKLL